MNTSTSMCQHCRIFLYDFLSMETHKDLQLTKQIRVKNLSKVLPEFVDWCMRMHSRIETEEFDKALLTASRIARRGRSIQEYECLIHTSTFNFLRFSHTWIAPEVDYMKILLIEAGVVNGKQRFGVLHSAQDYISYTLPRVILVLRDLHEDHQDPKGLYTDLNKLFLKRRPPQDDELTCHDRDNYQKEILEEVDLDDLYT